MRMSKKLALLLPTLLPAAGALPSGGRIPGILADVRRQEERRRRRKEQRHGRPETEILLAHDRDRFVGGGETDDTDVETLRFDQRLDHSSDENEREFETFPQRYFYTSRFVSENKGGGDKGGGEGALAFLCVGGEGPPLDPSVLVDSVHCTGDMIALAEKLHEERGMDVHLFALEHRFYGESFPMQNERGGDEGRVEAEGDGSGLLRGAEAEVEGEDEGEDEDESEDEDEDEAFEVDLSHLSSRQAVKDIVSFVKSPEVAKKIGSSKVTWITFGGSYPGMLSAWSHLLHPSVIFAAVSNSAPLQAELDFKEYKEVVGRDLSDAAVGGSDECLRIVREGHEQVVAALEGRGHEGEEEERERSGEDEDGVERVANMFDVCGGAKQLKASRRNMEAFVGEIEFVSIFACGVGSTPAELCMNANSCGLTLPGLIQHPSLSCLSH